MVPLPVVADALRGNDPQLVLERPEVLRPADLSAVSVRKMKSPKLNEDFMNDLIPSSIESEAFRTNAALTLDASRSISGWYDCRSTGMSGWRPLTCAAKSIPARSFGTPSLGKSMSEMTPRIASR